MHNYREAIPQLKELALFTQELTPEVKVKDVVELFNKDSSIKALAVSSQGYSQV